MNRKMLRAIVALVLTLAAGGAGYSLHSEGIATPHIPVQTVSTPSPGTVRVVYSLDQKQNDRELIALIDDAREYIYFAIYTFTLPSIADALVEAKKRGVVVKGIVDSEQSSNSYGTPIRDQLLAAGISLVTERHASGNGIMHIKLLVTERAYAFGSYNWTRSATTINDEILEVGTDPTLRQAYENILTKLLDTYKSNTVTASTAAPINVGVIDYTDAPKHIGETASVRGTLVRAYTSKTGTIFLDFCESYKTCPFSGVIFASDVKKFGLPAQAGDLSYLVGKTITLTGKISSYQGKAEIVLSSPSQIAQ